MFNNILYCTDTNYVDDKILTFINYAENYIWKDK
jgi:hypothetical protein